IYARWTAALLPVLLLPSPCLARPALTVSDLRCEYLPNPIGLDEPAPRLSWTLQSSQRAQRQTAYQVLVASSEARLRQGRGDLWDSGRAAGSGTAVYRGKPLASGERC